MILTLLTAALLTAAPALAQSGQPQPPRDNEPVPVALALQDLTDAYAAAITADEITARVTHRSLDRSEALTQTLTVRIDTDPETRELRRLLLELGPLRAHFENGQMLVTSSTAPDKFYRATYTPPLSSQTVQQLLPPIPAPQLAIATGLRSGTFPDITPYTPSVSFHSAIASTRTRPPSVLISGSGPAGPVTLITDVQTGRLVRFTADIGGSHPTSIELTCRAVEPGDPAQWKPDTAARQPVTELSALSPSPPTPLKPGDRAPDLSFSHPEQRIWSLLDTLAAAPKEPIPIIIWRWSREPQRAQSAMAAAHAGARALSKLRADLPQTIAPPVAAVALELADYTGVLLSDITAKWEAQNDQQPDLYWSPSAARSIDRFTPEADAVLILIAPDRRILSIIPLESRTPEDLLPQLRALLTPLDAP